MVALATATKVTLTNPFVDPPVKVAVGVVDTVTGVIAMLTSFPAIWDMARICVVEVGRVTLPPLVTLELPVVGVVPSKV